MQSHLRRKCSEITQRIASIQASFNINFSTMNENSEIETKLLERLPKDPQGHRRGDKFFNPFPTFKRQATLMEGFRWLRDRQRKGLADGWLEGFKTKPTPQDFLKALPVVPLNTRAILSPPEGKIQYTWCGHASVLVQLDGLSILTDPVFSERCSPFSFMGPKRVVPAPVSLAHDMRSQLGNLSMVLISHNHYDHADNKSIQALDRAYGSDLLWVIPPGVMNYMKSNGVRGKIVELDWWSSYQGTFATGGPGQGNGPRSTVQATIVATPTQHFSGRGLFDRNKSLWNSCAVISQASGRRFWFGGDTGYCGDSFRDVGERLGPFDLAAIPIGAYLPRSFMAPVHVDPEEAVKMHQDLRSKLSVAIHWGTFALTDEPMDEPPRLVRHFLKQSGIPESDFAILDHGETAVVGSVAGTEGAGAGQRSQRPQQHAPSGPVGDTGRTPGVGIGPAVTG